MVLAECSGPQRDLTPKVIGAISIQPCDLGPMSCLAHSKLCPILVLRPKVAMPPFFLARAPIVFNDLESHDAQREIEPTPLAAVGSNAELADIFCQLPSDDRGYTVAPSG
jgi:hypothetical protein